VTLRAKIAAGRAARLAAMPTRAATVARHDAQVLADSVRWLALSREHTNFTYDLEPRNVEHLAWFIAAIAGEPVDVIRRYIAELEADGALREHLEREAAASPRRGLTDRRVGYGRRAGWYALARSLRPERIVETGTDKGLGACVLAAAVLRNGRGRVMTIDTNDASGSLLGGAYAAVADLLIGDSVALLPMVGSVDLFIHDSLHTAEHEAAELEALSLTADAVALSDNAHVTNALAAWAERTGRRFLYFQERPRRHWYPGAGIGAAWRG
jgi:predicted O-methyltransferase YrrM